MPHACRCAICQREMKFDAPPVAVDLTDIVAERDRLRDDLRQMVEKAADKNLAGYRELGMRAANAENERDRLAADLAEAKDNQREVERLLRRRLNDYAVELAAWKQRALMAEDACEKDGKARAEALRFVHRLRDCLPHGLGLCNEVDDFLSSAEGASGNGSGGHDE